MAAAAPNPHKGEQMDIEKGKTDRAIRALRDYQGGKATAAFVRACLVDLEANQLLWVSLATRIPTGTLEKLKTGEAPS